MNNSENKSPSNKFNTLFIACVVIPTFLSTAYYGFLASDVYVSESRFVVRGPQGKTPSLLGTALTGAGFSTNQNNAYLVIDYIQSRDALSTLQKELDLSAKLGNDEIDLFSRFNAFSLDNSVEALHRYYNERIEIHLDTTSSIVTVKVWAFEPNDAKKINQRLLDLSENLVNDINSRSRNDLIQFAENEVAHAEKRALQTGISLLEYREAQGILDPTEQATIQIEQVGRLQEELINSESNLSQLVSLAPNSPQIPALKKRIETLRLTINAETEKVTGGPTSFAHKATDYQRLILQQEFAERQLTSALASLEEARNEAQRKQAYLERIIQPNLPDSAEKPRRIRMIIATLILGLIGWGILSLLLAGIREHQD